MLSKKTRSNYGRKQTGRRIIFRFGPPEQLHSDQGHNFESEVVQEIFKLLEIVKTRTSPYHLQSDGLVERMNRMLLDMQSSDLRRLCMAYNTSVQPTIRMPSCRCLGGK